MNENTIYSINGPVVKVKEAKIFSMLELVYVGKARLVGEVIAVTKEFTTIQVYESTTGLTPGEPVFSTGQPISVTLGPGILGNIFDGIERPLEGIAASHGSFIPIGSHQKPLDESRLWMVHLTVSAGDQLHGGDIYATIEETALITHKCMIPP
ncbi:MAG: V-type ATP synthase subunit A, partial [bacterium]